MSYIYANAKKARKRTKIETLKKHVAGLERVVSHCGDAIIVMQEALNRFGNENSWLEQVEEHEGPHGTGHEHTNYIWSGENNPVEQIKAVQAKVTSLLGPLRFREAAPVQKSTDSPPVGP